MKYKLKCNLCGATCWAFGSDDPETNAVEIKDKNLEWEDELENGCQHDDYEIIDYEDASDPEDYL